MFTRLGGGTASGITPRPAGQSLSELATIVSGKMDKRYAEKKEKADEQELESTMQNAFDSAEGGIVSSETLLGLFRQGGKEAADFVQSNVRTKYQREVSDAVQSVVDENGRFGADFTAKYGDALTESHWNTINQHEAQKDSQQRAALGSAVNRYDENGKDHLGRTREQKKLLSKEELAETALPQEDMDLLIKLYTDKESGVPNFEAIRNFIDLYDGITPETPREREEVAGYAESLGIALNYVAGKVPQGASDEDIYAASSQALEDVMEQLKLDSRDSGLMRKAFGDFSPAMMQSVALLGLSLEELAQGKEDTTTVKQFPMPKVPETLAALNQGGKVVDEKGVWDENRIQRYLTAKENKLLREGKSMLEIQRQTTELEKKLRAFAAKQKGGDGDTTPTPGNTDILNLDDL